MMVTVSIGDLILEDVATIMRNVHLFAVEADEIKVRELPKIGEEIDHLPCVLICEHGKITTNPLDMEGSAGHVYAVEICLIDASEGDYATDRKKRQLWHEQAIDAIDKSPDGQFRCDLPNVPKVWGIEVQEAPTFDRGKLSVLYSYHSVVVNFLTSE